MGQAQILALLQPAEQIPRFNSRLLGKGRRLDLAVKPDEGLLPRSHRHNKAMSNMTYTQVALHRRRPDGTLRQPPRAREPPSVERGKNWQGVACSAPRYCT